jgi:hypothetical protein
MAPGPGMAEFPVRVVLDVFVGAVLLLSALLLLGRARRFPANLLLAAFLALVAVNFLSPALTALTGDLVWDQVAFVALALDPLFLVAFVAAYPYPRWTRTSVAALAWLAVVALVSVPAILLRPEWVIPFTFGADVGSPWRFLLLVGGLGFGYACAWFLAIRSLREAPTLGLAQRALWAAFAVGVAVLPRLPLLPGELGLLHVLTAGLDPQAPLPEGLAASLALLAAQLGVAFALLLPAMRQLRGARTPTRGTRRFLRALGAVVAGLLALQVALGVLGTHVLTGAPVPNVPFAFRWVVFAAVLAHAVSAHQVLPLPDSGRNALPLAGGLVLGIGAALVALSQAWSATEDGALSVAIAAAIGLALVLPGVLLTRKALQGAERQPSGYAGLERRLALHRAALESAWARGPPGPGAARRLERLRLEFGLSGEEARALERVVRDGFREAERALAPGQEAIPGVVVSEVLGAGPQGRTYLARDLASGRRVVVKQLRAAASPEERRRLRGELQALARVDHPALPRLLDFRLDPSPLLLYAFAEGRPLPDLLRAGPMPAPEVRRMAAGLADALEHLHALGIVHGDVKPDNILVAEGGRASLVDYGLVRPSVDLRGTLAGWAGGPLAGTLAYMAPERARGKPAGPPSDRYSLGLVLAEALTGRPRRALGGLTPREAIEAVGEAAVDLSDVPAAWRPLLAKLLEPDPRRRPRGIRALLPAGARPATGASKLGEAVAARDVP